LFSPDIDTKSIEELAGYNIHTITYENSDGSHSGLKRLLKLYDNFIQKRGDSLVGVAEYNHDEVELATSLYFYNQIVLHDLTIIDRALVNSLLNILLDKKEGLSLIEIKNEIANRKILCDDLSIISSLKNIESKALITQDPINKKFIITDLGKDIVLNGKAINQDIKKKFIIYCMNFFNDYSLDMSSINRIVEQIDRGLISAFRKRGIEISKMLFDNSSTVSINSSTDILGELNGFASNDLLNQEEYLGFVELILNILQAPSQEVKDYLGILANGYFTYQILGHDREARTIRFSELKKRPVVIDSSILIPYFAQGCLNHDFAVDLLSELSKNSISMICTEKLSDELIDHAEWAIRYYKDKEFDDIAYYTAVVGSDFRQNLFLDGSMKWSIGKNVSTFSDYMTSLFSSTDISLYRNIFSKELEKIGVSIISMDQLPNFQVELYSAYEEAFEQIKTERTARLTYKNDRQCETEAELVIISRIHPISFLTHTSNLKQITSREEILHWSPEIMYRFIKLNSTSTELTDLYSCMIGDFLSCGFKVLDKETIAAFSSPLFKQARTQLDLLKNEFGDVLDKFLTEE
jgi:hypothetical protein